MIKLNAFMQVTLFAGASLAASQFSQAANISGNYVSDNYIGANDHGWGDVVGSVEKFDVMGLDVMLTGSMLSVNIYTHFAGRGDDGLFSDYTAGNTGIGYGDLFLSVGWNPYGDAPYVDDDNSNGNKWSYGFALDDRFMAASDAGTGMLYSLDGASNADNILMSDDFLTGATFRNDQEVAVNIGGDVTALNAGSWSIDAANNLINFQVDLAGTSLLGADVIGIRWQETCGNDVIEAGVSLSAVPVPAAVWLFGSGVLGLVAVARRRNSQ